MAEQKINKRELIKELIETGDFTKKEIAAKLDMKEAGVSSQLTYLRWMGNFIIWDDDKKLSFATEEEYNEWQEAKAPAKKNVSTKTVPEQIAALTKTVINQGKQLAKWEDKLVLLRDDKTIDETLVKEAEANITLLRIKLDRNEDKLNALGPVDDVEDDDVEDVDDIDEELL